MSHGTWRQQAALETLSVQIKIAMALDTSVIAMLKEKIDAQLPCKDTLLTLASRSGNFQAVTDLVEGGADVDAFAVSSSPRHSNYRFFRSALQVASEMGHCDIVNYLLSQRVDVAQAATQWDVQALHLACENGHLSVVQSLCEARAAIDCRCSKGFAHQSATIQPLHLACENGHLEVARYLCEARADIHCTSADTIGYVAPQMDDPLTVMRTPMFFAVQACNAPLVQYLRSIGAASSCNTSMGRLPFNGQCGMPCATAEIAECLAARRPHKPPWLEEDRRPPDADDYNIRFQIAQTVFAARLIERRDHKHKVRGMTHLIQYCIESPTKSKPPANIEWVSLDEKAGLLMDASGHAHPYSRVETELMSSPKSKLNNAAVHDFSSKGSLELVRSSAAVATSRRLFDQSAPVVPKLNLAAAAHAENEGKAQISAAAGTSFVDNFLFGWTNSKQEEDVKVLPKVTTSSKGIALPKSSIGLAVSRENSRSTSCSTLSLSRENSHCSAASVEKIRHHQAYVEIEEFSFQVDRCANMPLGMTLHEDGRALAVRHVFSTCSMPIIEGDRIIAINGSRGDSKVLMYMIRGTGFLDVTCQRMLSATV